MSDMRTDIEIIDYKYVHTDTNFLSGKNSHRGCLQLLVSRAPEFVYKQIGDYYYAEDSGFINVFEHKPDYPPEGFGGVKIKLNMIDGTVREFKGTLWYPWQVTNDRVPDYKPCTYTTDKEAYGRGHTFNSCDLNPMLYDKLVKAATRYQPPNAKPVPKP